MESMGLGKLIDEMGPRVAEFKPNLIRLYFGILLAVVFVALGIGIINHYPDQGNKITGGLLVAGAVFLAVYFWCQFRSRLWVHEKGFIYQKIGYFLNREIKIGWWEDLAEIIEFRYVDNIRGLKGEVKIPGKYPLNMPRMYQGVQFKNGMFVSSGFKNAQGERGVPFVNADAIHGTAKFYRMLEEECKKRKVPIFIQFLQRPQPD